MKCKHIQQKMIEYSEKLLDEKARTQVDEHLQKCSTCAQELNDVKHTLDLLQSVTFPEPPESFWIDFTSSVMSKINKMESPSPTSRLFSFPQFKIKMAVAFLVLIAIIGGLYLYFNAEIQQIPHPVDNMAELPGQGNTLPQSPDHPYVVDTLETTLGKIAPEDLRQDILESDLALFDGKTDVTFDIDYSDDMLYSLINSLTEEEKRALLSELYKMGVEAR